MTDEQKYVSQAIVNIIETGRLNGDYSAVTVLKGDTGHLTYGRSQTTLGSGNLYKLIDMYMDVDIELNTCEVQPYLKRLKNRDTSLDTDKAFHTLLRKLGTNPIMQNVQDDFFDLVYWEPAVSAAHRFGLTLPLSVAVVYDSFIHGSWKRIRNMTNSKSSLLRIGEKKWVAQYVSTRRHWLANHSNRILNKTVYRMDAFTKLIENDKWSLLMPLNVRGIMIDGSAVAATPRPVWLTSPLTRGPTVTKLQKLLNSFLDSPIDEDGIFGKHTESMVRAFQLHKGLVADGVVGTATWTALQA